MTKYITSTPGIIGGKPAIVGTRIPVSRIVYLLSQGYTIDTIHDDYPWVRTQDFYEKFDVLELHKPDEFKRFYSILCKHKLM